ncbi:hypothetical protein [Planococcus sp. YIM B11945]|uniref:hypothetical protein n=1 Tax=Planococcus sp. YIM B11945 TaxID=3435410 RepID=UPI003D7DBCF7
MAISTAIMTKKTKNAVIMTMMTTTITTNTIRNASTIISIGTNTSIMTMVKDISTGTNIITKYAANTTMAMKKILMTTMMTITVATNIKH